MEREHSIYLTSTGNLDIFPNNNPCRFINRLAAPITLDPNYDYEIGLVSILYPNEYYAIVGNQYKNKLTFYTKFHTISKIQKYSYTLQNSILAGDIEKLIYLLVKLFSVCAVVPIFITLLGCARISRHVPRLFILFNFSSFF